jgi:hypothetical protein
MRPKRVTKEVMPLPKKKDNKEDKKYDKKNQSRTSCVGRGLVNINLSLVTVILGMTIIGP